MSVLSAPEACWEGAGAHRENCPSQPPSASERYAIWEVGEDRAYKQRGHANAPRASAETNRPWRGPTLRRQLLTPGCAAHTALIVEGSRGDCDCATYAENPDCTRHTGSLWPRRDVSVEHRTAPHRCGRPACDLRNLALFMHAKAGRAFRRDARAVEDSALLRTAGASAAGFQRCTADPTQ